jgi:hypothetical protein
LLLTAAKIQFGRVINKRGFNGKKKYENIRSNRKIGGGSKREKISGGGRKNSIKFLY